MIQLPVSIAANTANPPDQDPGPGIGFLNRIGGVNPGASNSPLIGFATGEGPIEPEIFSAEKNVNDYVTMVADNIGQVPTVGGGNATDPGPSSVTVPSKTVNCIEYDAGTFNRPARKGTGPAVSGGNMPGGFVENVSDVDIPAGDNFHGP